MRVIKQKGRVYKHKEYFKYILVIPSFVITNLKWKEGDNLQFKLKNNNLILRKL